MIRTQKYERWFNTVRMKLLALFTPTDAEISGQNGFHTYSACQSACHHWHNVKTLKGRISVSVRVNKPLLIFIQHIFTEQAGQCTQ